MSGSKNKSGYHGGHRGHGGKRGQECATLQRAKTGRAGNPGVRATLAQADPVLQGLRLAAALPEALDQ